MEYRIFNFRRIAYLTISVLLANETGLNGFLLSLVAEKNV